MPIVVVGVRHAIEVPEAPRVGSVFNLRNAMLLNGGGRYRVSSADSMKWEGFEYPKVNVERVGDVPDGEETISLISIK